MATKLDLLSASLQEVFQESIASIVVANKEVTITVSQANYLDVMQQLRDHPSFAFEQLMDLCGVDYSTYGGVWEGLRYGVVAHLLSIKNNWRLRVCCFAESDAFPVVPSVVNVWNSVVWFEREAYDLYGIVFSGHPDLRRILTDYGFVGHPFRKDFPVCGYVEMRYDAEQKRVVYQPVTIEEREITPRIIRENTYGDVGNG